MTHFVRLFYVVHNEAKTKHDLGLVLEKHLRSNWLGIGWTRAFQMVPFDNENQLPRGHVEYQKVS